MGARAHEDEEAVFDHVDQQPVWSDVAFTVIGVVTCQEVVSMRRLQRLFLPETFNDLTELGHGLSLTLDLFDVLLEAIGGSQV
jgi:hypothetical protein